VPTLRRMLLATHETGSPRRWLMAIPAIALAFGLPLAGADAQLPPIDAKSRAILARQHTPGGTLIPAPLSPAGTGGPLGIGVAVQFAVAERPFAGVNGDETADGTWESMYAVSSELPIPRAPGRLRRARLGATVGVIDATCTEPNDGQVPCPMGYMFGVSARALVWEHGPAPDDTSARGPAAGVGLGADWGFGDQQTTARAWGISAPLWVAFRITRRSWLSERDLRFRPRTVVFIEPGIAEGALTNTAGKSRARLGEIAVGVSVLDIGPGFGASAGMRRLLASGAPSQLAFAFSWHRR
jgi:hypothetical protein